MNSKKRKPGRPAGRTLSDGVIVDREKLLIAAEELIGSAGPSVSLAQIALKAGVTKPTLYRELGDKDALVKALAERLSERLADSVMRLVSKAASPRDALKNFAAGYLSRAALDRNLYLFVTAGGTGEDRVQQSLLLADQAVAQFSAGIAASREAQGEDPEVAKVWSYGLLGALHFVTLWWLRDQDAVLDVVVDQIVTLLWSGMQVSDQQ